MGLGKQIRMNRLFARPSGRMFAVAVDHFFAYQKDMPAGVVASGAKGMTVGRNVWGFPKVAKIVKAFSAVIHDRVAPAAAMHAAGL